VIAASTSGLSLLQAKSGYDRQLDAAEQVERAARANALRQYQSIQSRQIQERAKATQEIQESNRAARRASSTAAVASAEAGVGGNSVAALQDEFERTALEFESTTIRNMSFLDAEFKDRAEGVRAEQEATVNAAYNQIQTPNYLGILMQGLGTYLDLSSAMKATRPVQENP
jgi:hypothetical protein